MKDSKAETLKKRVHGDGICCIIIALALGVVALGNIYEGIMVSIGRYAYNQSPAITFGEASEKLLICIVFVLLSSILAEIKKNGKPFTKQNVTKLRVMAWLCIAVAVLPSIVTSFAGFFDDKAVFQLTFNLIPGLFGAFIGIISEIFHYGHELQDEMDSIA